MNQITEYLQTLQDLHTAKLKLIDKEKNTLMKKKLKLAEQEKMYRKLSDIEVTLSKIECHTNEQLKLNRFMAKMMFCSVHLSGNRRYNEHEEVMNKYWQEFLRIAD